VPVAHKAARAAPLVREFTNDVMILSYDANPRRMGFSETTGVHQTSLV
jgi:hypothetical protein